MILLSLALAQAAAAVPSAEAQALGARIARGGSIMVLLPLVAEKDVEELISSHPDLSDADRQRVRAAAQTTLRQGLARIEAAFGAAYAKRLSLTELRVLAAQVESPAQRRLREIQPQAMTEAITSLGELEFKKDVAAAICRDTRKLCPTPETR